MKKSTNCINYPEISAGRIAWKMPTQKSAQQNKAINYHDLPAKYKYSDNGGESEFLFDGPKMKSKRGAVLNQFNKWHMTFMLDESNPEHVLFIQKINEIYESNIKFIAETDAKIIINMPAFNAMTAPMVFSSPIFTPTDKEKRTPIPGANKLFNPSLINSSYPGSSKKTIFTDCSPDLNIIDWSLVRDTEVECIPRFHVTGDYIGGGKIILQFKMISAIVLDLVNTNMSSQQFEVAERIRNEDPNAANRLKDTIAKILLEKKNTESNSSSLLTSPPKGKEGKEEETTTPGSPLTNQQSSPPPQQMGGGIGAITTPEMVGRMFNAVSK